MKKVGIMIPDFEVGGMPVVASRLLKFLKAKYDLTLIIISGDAAIKYPTYEARVIQGPKRGSSLAAKALVFGKRYFWLKKLLAEENFAAVISFGVLANVFNAQCERERAILTEHNVKSVEDKQWGLPGTAYDILIKKTYHLAYKTGCVSKGVADDLKQHYGLKNAITLYNPFDKASIEKKGEQPLDSKTSKLFSGNRVILSVGRLTASKQPQSLVKAFQEVAKNIPDAKLLLAGVGDQQEELAEQIAQEKLTNKVILLGSRSDVPALMRHAYLTVLVSTNEGLPNVLLESLAQKTPVVATDIVAGPKEILSNGSEDNYFEITTKPRHLPNGILIPPVKPQAGRLSNSEQVLAKVLTKSLLDPDFKQSFTYNISTFCHTEPEYVDLIEQAAKQE